MLIWLWILWERRYTRLGLKPVVDQDFLDPQLFQRHRDHDALFHGHDQYLGAGRDLCPRGTAPPVVPDANTLPSKRCSQASSMGRRIGWVSQIAPQVYLKEVATCRGTGGPMFMESMATRAWNTQSWRREASMVISPMRYAIVTR